MSGAKATARRRGGYESLRKLIRNIREVASGATVANVIIRCGAYLRGRVKGELSRHVKTGLARQTATVTPNVKAITIRLQKYRTHIKWSFKKGIPISAIKRFEKILTEELERAVKGGT